MSNYWNYVFNYIDQVNYIYFAVGCGMPQYRFSDEVKSNYMFDITEKNNQQYPCFMHKFVGKKMIILIDNELEFTKKNDSSDNNNTMIERELVIQQFFTRIEQPLEIILNNQTLRILSNKDTIVIASKSNFYYEETQFMNKNDIDMFRENFTTFNNMIEICIHDKKKLIVQDYSGRDLTNVYLRFLDIYGSKILNNIMFDVTQNNGGCFIELKPSYASMDRNGNFIQEKYSKLVNCLNSEMYDDIYKSRLSQINYPLSWSIFKMNDDETYSDINFANYKLLFNIYECEYDAKNKSKSLLVLIKKILEDILKSNGGDLSRVGDIMSKIMDRPSFNKELALLQR
jgi:hypothetical protein